MIRGDGQHAIRNLDMTTEVWQFDRPKGRPPVWACRVTDGPTVIFESYAVSLRLLSRDAASWIARVVEELHGAVYPLEWRGDLEDDCSAAWKRFVAHAEHLQGPHRGGIWYCSVSDLDGKRFFHTADRKDIQPKSGAAARWLCELVISAAEAGSVGPYVA